MNRLAIRDLARKRLGETTAAFWSDAELNTWINDGMRDIAYRTKCLKTNALVSPTSAVSEYVLSTILPSVTSITEVYFRGTTDQWTKLIPTSRTELDVIAPSWLSAEAATPTHYWWDREDNVFYLYPSIKTAETDSLKFYYTVDSTDLSGDADSPVMPAPLHMAVVDFVVATGFETRGWSEKANDAWAKCFKRISDYTVERNREREDDDCIMRNYRNL